MLATRTLAPRGAPSFALLLATLSLACTPVAAQSADTDAYVWATYFLVVALFLFYCTLVAAMVPYARPRFPFFLILALAFSPPFFFFFVIYLLLTVSVAPQIIYVERPVSRNDIRAGRA